MSLTLDFIGAAPGDKCELFHGAPYKDRELEGKIDPLQTVRLDESKRATFSADPGNGYAVRLIDAKGKVYGRSNTRALAGKRTLFALPITVSLTEAEFAASTPKVPLIDGKTTFDKLQLDFVGEDLRVFGHAIHDGVINKKFGFDYRFRILPIDIPVWTPLEQLPKDETPADTLELDTTSFTIDADRNRQEVLMAVLNPIIRRKFRKGIQRTLHEAMAKQTEGNVVKPVLTITKVTVEDTKRLTLAIGVLGEPLG